MTDQYSKTHKTTEVKVRKTWVISSVILVGIIVLCLALAIPTKDEEKIGTRELTTLIMIWALVTTAVVVLAYMRMTMGLHDILDIHLSGNQPGMDAHDTKISKRVRTIDRIGIPLTIVSALLALAILAQWAMQQAGPN